MMKTENGREDDMANKEEAQNQSERYEELLASVLGLALEVVRQLKFDRKNGQHLYAVCLFARLVELAAGCKALLEKDALVGLPVLVRSMFEAQLDLTNCVKDADYFKQMYVGFLEQRRRLTREVANNPSNPFVDTIVASRNPESDLESIEAELHKFRAQGFKNLSIRDRAERAGQLDEYNTVYLYLCLDTHNNMRSLETRHMEVRSDTDYNVSLFKCQKGDLLPALSSLPGILLIQTKAMCDFFGLQDIDLTRYFQVLHALNGAHE